MQPFAFKLATPLDHVVRMDGFYDPYQQTWEGDVENEAMATTSEVVNYTPAGTDYRMEAGHDSDSLSG